MLASRLPPRGSSSPGSTGSNQAGSYWYLAPSHVFWAATLALLADRLVAVVARGRLSALARARPAFLLVCALGLTSWLVAERRQMEPNFYSTLRSPTERNAAAAGRSGVAAGLS